MMILIALVGIALAIGVTLFLARRLDLQFDAKDDGKGHLGRRIMLILLTFLTLGVGVCGGTGTFVGLGEMLSDKPGNPNVGPVVLSYGIVGLICTGIGAGLIYWLSRRPPKAGVEDEYRKDRP